MRRCWRPCKIRVMRLMIIVGTRPQFVKLAPLSHTLKNYSNITTTILDTGQHYDHNMSEVFLKELDIPKPDYNLNINNLPHGAMTGRLLEAIESILLREKPEMVIVFGDTNSALAGALAAKKLNIALAHIEAGLRSYDNIMPEELNRIIIDRISDLLFCPTAGAVLNLQREGFDVLPKQYFCSGDIMLDTMELFSQAKANNVPPYQGDYLLFTLHRQDNIQNQEKLSAIIQAISIINKHIQVIMPIHPRTAEAIMALDIQPEFETIPSVGYAEMYSLLKNCKMVITDSGGLQKEAFFHKKGCLVVRNNTEWTELAEGGFSILAGTEKETIIDAYNKLTNMPPPDYNQQIFGNGKAAGLIIEKLIDWSKHHC